MPEPSGQPDRAQSEVGLEACGRRLKGRAPTLCSGVCFICRQQGNSITESFCGDSLAQMCPFIKITLLRRVWA